MKRTSEHFGPAAYGLHLWAHYMSSLDGHFPPFRDKNAWMAATRGRYEEDVLQKKADVQALAQEEGCTARTVLMRMRRLHAAMQDEDA